MTYYVRITVHTVPDTERPFKAFEDEIGVTATSPLQAIRKAAMTVIHRWKRELEAVREA